MTIGTLQHCTQINTKVAVTEKRRLENCHSATCYFVTGTFKTVRKKTLILRIRFNFTLKACNHHATSFYTIFKIEAKKLMLKAIIIIAPKLPI